MKLDLVDWLVIVICLVLIICGCVNQKPASLLPVRKAKAALILPPPPPAFTGPVNQLVIHTNPAIRTNFIFTWTYPYGPGAGWPEQIAFLQHESINLLLPLSQWPVTAVISNLPDSSTYMTRTNLGITNLNRGGAHFFYVVSSNIWTHQVSWP